MLAIEESALLQSVGEIDPSLTRALWCCKIGTLVSFLVSGDLGTEDALEKCAITRVEYAAQIDFRKCLKTEKLEKLSRHFGIGSIDDFLNLAYTEDYKADDWKLG